MAAINLKHLHKVKAKGKLYVYAWRGGPRIEAEIGTPEFFEEFLSHKNPTAALDKKSFGAWVVLFKGSAEYAEFGKSTKANWGPKLDDARKRFGKTPVRAFDRPAIRGAIKQWRDQWRDTPRTADMAKQALSRLCSFIVSEGALSLNPCEGIPNIYSSNRSEIIWTPEDIDTLCAVASPEVAWVVRLAALTGLRQGALLKLSWTRVGKLAIDTRGKKGREKHTGLIPIYADLRKLLDTIPKRATTVLTNSAGKPWTSDGFRSSFGKTVEKAKLEAKELHFHDLRGTAATNLYRANFTVQEIADVMGWETEAIQALIDRYVKRDELMLDRIRRMDALPPKSSEPIRTPEERKL